MKKGTGKIASIVNFIKEASTRHIKIVVATACSTYPLEIFPHFLHL